MLLVLLNAHHEPLPFTLPAHKRSISWQMNLDTAATRQDKQCTLLRWNPYNLHARSLAILRVQKKPTDGNLSSMKPHA
jgi:isoamylase